MECYYGKGSKRRVIGWLVVGLNGLLRYVPRPADLEPGVQFSDDGTWWTRL
jgi:hypothetical protein